MTTAPSTDNKSTKIWHTILNPVALGALFVVSRIPLLKCGFGLDADAWRIANTAFDLRYHQVYHASRLPGYPLPEFANALFIDHGWLATNSLTLLVSLFSVLIYMRILRNMEHPNARLLTITYAFLPILWVNSTNTMDYMWALCFIMLAWFTVLRKQWITAGVFMGLAIGSRLPLVVFLLPFSFLCYSAERKTMSMIKFLLAAILMSMLLYSPLVLTYGWGFFQRYPTRASVLQIGYMAVKHFGLVPLIALIVLLAFSCRNFYRSVIQRDRHVLFSSSVVAIGLVVFALMPYHIEYLIPIIPFFLLVTYRVGKKPMLTLLSILAISHALITILNVQHIGGGKVGTGIIESGVVIRNFTERQQQLEFASRLARTELPTRSTVIIGPWLPVVAYLGENLSSNKESKMMYDPNIHWQGVQDFQRDISYRYLLTQTELNELQKQHYTIYYIKGMRQFTLDVYGYDLADHGTKYLNLRQHLH